MAARAVLARNGVETEVVYPHCCGMPLLEQGASTRWRRMRKAVAARAQGPGSTKGYDVIALVPSCALMLKFEWPLILPGDEDVAALSKATYDVSEYVVDIARKEGLAPGCSRSKAASRCTSPVMPAPRTWARRRPKCCASFRQADVQVIERCSGHGGSWGVKKAAFRDGAEGGPAGGTPGRAKRQGLRHLGMPARRPAYRPGDGQARTARRRSRSSITASDRAFRARLRHRLHRRGGSRHGEQA